MFLSYILRSIITLLALSAYTISTYAMWRSAVTRFAPATQTMRTQLPKGVQWVAKTISSASIQKSSTHPMIQDTAQAYMGQKLTISNWLSKNQTSKKVVHSPKRTIATLKSLLAPPLVTTNQAKKNLFTFYTIKTQTDNAAYRKQAVEFALTNITTQDAAAIELIITILKTYRESHDPIVRAALAHFNTAHPALLKNILAHSNACTADIFAKQLISTENPHLKKLFSKNPENDYLWHHTQIDYNWTVSYYASWAPSDITKFIIDSIIAHPETCSIKNYNTVYEAIVLPSIRLKLQKAAIQYYGPPSYDQTLNLNQLMYLYKKDSYHRLHNNLIKELLGAPSLKKDYRSTENDIIVGTFKKPIPLYTVPTLEQVKKAMLALDLTELTRANIDFIIDYIFPHASSAEKETFTQKLCIQYPFAQSNALNHALDNSHSIRLGMRACVKENHQATHSEKHFCANARSVIQNIFRKYKTKQQSYALSLFKKALVKEREELAKGNHVFYHSRRWKWDLVSDIYKGLYNIIRPTQKSIGDDYTFLHFDDPTASFRQALFLNASLFAHSDIGRSCAQLILINSAQQGIKDKVKKFTPQKLFSQFNLQQYHSRYEKEFQQLAALHQQANPFSMGSLLMVSVNDADVNTIYPVQTYAHNKKPVTLSTGEKTVETKKILAELKAGILPFGGDTIDYVLPLDEDYALHPEEGPRIYAMNACDPEKYKEYTNFRDQLFAKIKQDFTEDSIEKSKQYPLINSNVLRAALHHYDLLPSFIFTCTDKNHTHSPSEKHFCANTQLVIQNIFKKYNIKQKTNAIPLFKKALAKEREELAKGNHVFYHGRKWEWDLVSDIFKNLHNIAHVSKKPIENDYTFLRFDNSTAKFGQALFLNAPLFGSSKWYGNSTAQLILSSFDWSGDKVKEFTPQELFSQFNLQKIYPNYAGEFQHLAVLHQRANPAHIGSLLMVSINDANVNTIYPVRTYAHNRKPVTLSTGEQTLETKKILAELKAGKLPGGGDTIEYVLPLSKDYALDPEKGPRIYALNACDPAKYKEYTDYRDQLFAKIKADIQQNGGKIS